MGLRDLVIRAGCGLEALLPTIAMGGWLVCGLGRAKRETSVGGKQLTAKQLYGSDNCLLGMI